MENETTPASLADCCGKKHKHWHQGGGMGGVYCVAFIGAAVYYIQHSNTFWMGVVGILKALVWPAFLIYEALKFLKM
jgi:hypothetical protein